MNFIVEKEEFLQKLRIVEKVTLSNKSTIPVLSNILFETVGNDKIKLSATDNDIAIFAFANVEVKKEGKITIPAKLIIDIISKLPNSDVEILLNEENNKISILCGKTKYSLSGVSADEFPKIIDEEELKEENSIKIELKPLIKCIKKTSFAAAMYETKNIISGVSCFISENKMELAATDGNRLARYIEELSGKYEEKRFVVPSRAMAELQRIDTLISDKDVLVFVTDTMIIFKTETMTIISKLLTGQFPAYEQLIPKTCAKNIVIDKDDFIKALERVCVLVDEKNNTVKINLSEDKMVLKTQNSEKGESEDTLVIEYKDEDMEIAFNYKYLVETLKNIEEDKVKMGLNGSLSASLFTIEDKENYQCLIMPKQIR